MAEFKRHFEEEEGKEVKGGGEVQGEPSNVPPGELDNEVGVYSI